MKLFKSVAAPLFGAWSLTAAASMDAASPQDVLRTTADQVLSEVTAKKTELDQNPAGIYKLVEQTVVPRFDFTTMTQAAVGRYWPRATEQQRTELTDQFKELLVRTYAVALLGYSGQQIEYLPVRLNAGDTDVLIPTRIPTGTGGPPVPINYRMHQVAGQWLVYDVVIDGISLVTNYRSTFASTVRSQGIDGLIKQLSDRNQQLRG